LGARGFVVRDVVEVGDELVVAIETTTEVLVGCASCGTACSGEGPSAGSVA
jgi:hypothetical protein